MKVVPDTNTVVSGLLWHGAPHELLLLAREGKITLYTSPALLAELRDVLSRPKFIVRLRKVGTTPRKISLEFAALAKLARPEAIVPVVPADPDDDVVLACAISASAQIITSGDSHLLALKSYLGIPIVTAREFLNQFSPSHHTVSKSDADERG